MTRRVGIATSGRSDWTEKGGEDICVLQSSERCYDVGGGEVQGMIQLAQRPKDRGATSKGNIRNHELSFRLAFFILSWCDLA